MKPKIVQYGAGNIGRSLVGQLFSAAGWEVVFVDVVPEVIEALNARRSYEVIVKEREESRIRVEGVRGVDGRDSERVAGEIAACDFLATAVGANILPKIAPVVAEGLKRREEPLDILLCENLRGAPEIFREALQGCLPPDFPLEDRVGLIATSIGKMVPILPAEVRQRDPLEVWAEAYNRIIADRAGFVGPIPQVEGLVVRDCFEAYVDRKLFVHNLGHAAAAYVGDHHGAKTIAEAMAIPEVAATARGAMEESGKALVALYPEELTEEGMQEHIEDLLRRFRNPALGDTVFRVGRDRPRKYAPHDRLIGALRAQARAGVDSSHTIRATAAGLSFRATDEEGTRFPPDVEFARRLERLGVEGLMKEVCGLNGEEDWEREVRGQIVQSVIATSGD
jgi:mannitol-1-phosphate 5-dehydrogenase